MCRICGGPLFRRRCLGYCTVQLQSNKPRYKAHGKPQEAPGSVWREWVAEYASTKGNFSRVAE